MPIDLVLLLPFQQPSRLEQNAILLNRLSASQLFVFTAILIRKPLHT